MKTETENGSESKNKIPQHIATAFILLFLFLFFVPGSRGFLGYTKIDLLAWTGLEGAWFSSLFCKDSKPYTNIMDIYVFMTISK